MCFDWAIVILSFRTCAQAVYKQYFSMSAMFQFRFVLIGGHGLTSLELF